MKKIIFALLTSLLIFSCSSKENIYSIDKIFDFDYLTRGLCIAKDNVVKFYWLENDFSWCEASNLEFIIPSDCKDIFSYGSRLGVITDTKISFYKNIIIENPKEYDWESYPWYEEKEMQFNLPVNIQTAFGYFANIAVVADNKLNDYYFDEKNNEWKVIPNTEFILPQNWQYIFDYEDAAFCLVTDNIMRIYWYGYSWEEYTGMVFNLPENYEYVFSNTLGEGYGLSYELYEQEAGKYKWIGVSKDSKIKYYYFPVDKWEEVKYIEFNQDK